jgi:hypothetical protein
MWTVTAAAIFLGISKTLSAPQGEVIFLVCWVFSVVVLRLLLGWRVALLLSAAFGAVFGCFPIKHNPMLRSPAEDMILGVVGGIVVGSALAGLAIVVGWLMHQLAQITIGVQFPKSHNKTECR